MRTSVREARAVALPYSGGSNSRTNWKILVEKTKKWKGLPRICSTSKDEKMRTTLSMNTTTIGGIMTGSVTRVSVRMLEAPATRAASSNATFMFRNAGVSSITLPEIVPPIRWAKMMPSTL